MAMFEKNHFQKTGSVRPKKILLPCFQLMRITPPRPIEPLLIQPFKEVEVGNNILIEAEVLQQIGAIEPSKGFIEAIIGQLSCLDCT